MHHVRLIGRIHSDLKNISDCPLQESEGAPQASLAINKKYRRALSGLGIGDKVVLLTWLHQADRTVLTTRPRNNPKAALMGVFATRSPDRPNPIGLHTAIIVAITADREMKLSNLEVIDGTPVIDIKPYL